MSNMTYTHVYCDVLRQLPYASREQIVRIMRNDLAASIFHHGHDEVNRMVEQDLDAIADALGVYV